MPVVKNYNFNDLGTLSSTQYPREVIVFVSYFGKDVSSTVMQVSMDFAYRRDMKN